MPLLPLAQLADVWPGILELPPRLAARTLEEYRRDAQQYLAWCGWDKGRALDPQTLRAWCREMDDTRKLSPNTINRRLWAIKTLVRVSAACEALDQGLAFKFGLIEPVGLSPLRHRLQRRRALTPEQVRALCRAPNPASLIGLRDRALLATLASSGCRISEVLVIRSEDLTPHGGSWLVSILGKGQWEPRQAPLSGEAYAWLQRWLSVRVVHGIDVPHIFTGCGGPLLRPTATPLSKPSAWRRIKGYAAQIGLPRLTPHDLRRFVGTEIAKKHGLRQAQKALGHRRSETTARYYVFDEMQPGLSEGLY